MASVKEKIDALFEVDASGNPVDCRNDDHGLFIPDKRECSGCILEIVNEAVEAELEALRAEVERLKAENKYLKSSKPTFGDMKAEVARIGCGELIDQLRDPEGTAHIVRVEHLQMWVHREFARLRAEREEARRNFSAASTGLKRNRALAREAVDMLHETHENQNAWLAAHPELQQAPIVKRDEVTERASP